MKLILLTTSLPVSDIMFRSELVYRRGRTHVKVGAAVHVCNPSAPRAKMGSRGKIPTSFQVSQPCAETNTKFLSQGPTAKAALWSSQVFPSLSPTPPPPPTPHTTLQTWFKRKILKKHLLSNPIYSSIPPSYFKSSSQTFKAKWGSSRGTLALYNKCDPKNPCVNLYF